MKKLLLQHAWTGILCVIILAVCIANFTPNTYLSGWDNLHPEFNFLVNIKRSIFSAWQEYQGLGLLGGMAHASDLPRQIGLFLISFIIPAQYLRYVFHFSMLFAGTLGTFAVLWRFVLPKKSNGIMLAAFIGALFYLLNLGTAQYFLVPYEAFSMFWGMFPWLLYFIFQFIEKPTRKNLLFLTLIHFFASPLSYVQTLFYVYVLAVILLLLTAYMKKQVSGKNILFVILAIAAANAYWFLPNSYWIATSRDVTQNAAINRLTTDETFERTREYGTLSNFPLLRNKPWDYRDFSKTETVQPYLMEVWRNHFQNPGILAAGYGFFGIIIFGLFVKSRYRMYLVSLFVLSSLILLSNTPGIREINILLRNIPLLHQALRDPFTKFIVPTIFVFSASFSLGIFQIIHLIRKIKIQYTMVAIISMMLVLYMKPAFAGNFITPRMRVEIPQNYFDLFTFFKQIPVSSRIANLPQGSLWGWTSYDWGYTGSGFLWYGIEQPILDRAFDVWSNENENYYWELNYALNKEDSNLLQQVLSKYDVSYVLYDRSVYFPDNPTSVVYTDKQEEFIRTRPFLTSVRTFGTIDLYKVNSPAVSSDFMSIGSNLPVVAPAYEWTQQDSAYSDNGNYFINTSKPTVAYPFRSLFTARSSHEIPFSITENQKTITFSSKIETSGTLTLPPLYAEEPIINQEFKPASVSIQGRNVSLQNDQVTKEVVTPGTLTVSIPKTTGYSSFRSKAGDEFTVGTAVPCNFFSNEKDESRFLQRTLSYTDEGFIRFHSYKAHNCRSIYLPNLEHRNGFIVGVNSRNKQGRPLMVWLENLTEKRVDQQLYLTKHENLEWEYFIIPPMQQDGVGYSLHFDNIAVADETVINELAEVFVYQIPYEFLSKIKITTPLSQNSGTLNPVTSTEHTVPSLYTLNTNLDSNKKTQALILSQSFDSGWIAYETPSELSRLFPIFFGKPLTKHVLVNNWANGWILENRSATNSGQQVTIVFWPQYLEYIGFGLLALAFLYLLRSRKYRSRE